MKFKSAFKKVAYLLLSSLFVVALVSCDLLFEDVEKKEEEIQVSSVSVTDTNLKTSATVTLGDGTNTIQLKVTVYPKTIQNPVVTWKSSKTSVAKVDNNGLVTIAGELGEATITARSGGKSGSYYIKVNRAESGETNNTVVSGATKGESVGTSGKSFVANSNNASDFTVLVWSDEFEGTSLKSSNWKYETGHGQDGWGNCESQNYTTSTENSEVKGDVLRITVKGDGVNDPTSARIITKDLKKFKYGKLEARIKADEGQWSWPAFWMLGQNIDSVGWPKCGEIDIMEHAGTDSFIYSTLHWYNNGQADSGSTSASSVKNFKMNEWHIYSLEWTESNISMYVDDIRVFSMAIGSGGTTCFNEEAFFILNFAAGGGFFGDVGKWRPASDFAGVNWNMYVDYVRVYQDAAHSVDGNAAVAVTDVSISGNVDDLKAGDTVQLTATVTPSNATDSTVTWTSSNTSVATVDSTGKVTCVKAGNATITATAGGKSATKDITVNAKQEAPSGASIPLEGFHLVWNDEFDEADSDGTPLSSKWGYDIGRGQSKNTDGTNPNNWAWGNDELQWYSDNDPDNTYVSDGTLKIVAKKESSNGADYTSGRIVTRNISGGQFKYGYIEMSAKIPNDKGVWPAFWMLDNDIYNGEGWPGSGEIDIMETSVNLWGSNVVKGTLHCRSGYGGNPVISEPATVNFSDGKFHKYAVNWDDDHIDWYYDDVKVFTYNPASYENDPWPFKDDFYIILNLAVGGGLGGDVPTDFTSSTMEVDYVRVWQRDSGYTDRDGAVPNDDAPTSTVAKTIPSGAKVIFDSSATITNPVTNFYDSWNGGWTTSDYTAGSDKIKQVSFTSLNYGNSCGGWDISGYAYSANTKLHLSVYASHSFAIKPVKPDSEYPQTVSPDGTYKWVDVEIDLGAANSLSQIGFVSTVLQNIWVDHVYLTEGDSGNTGGEGETSAFSGNVNPIGGYTLTPFDADGNTSYTTSVGYRNEWEDQAEFMITEGYLKEGDKVRVSGSITVDKACKVILRVQLSTNSAWVSFDCQENDFGETKALSAGEKYTFSKEATVGAINLTEPFFDVILRGSSETITVTLENVKIEHID